MHPRSGTSRGTRPRLLVLATMVIVLGGCGASPREVPTPTPAVASTDGAEASPPSSAQLETPTAGAATPAVAASPTAEPEPSSSPEATTTPAGAADACTGSAENRDFYAAVAEAVDWTVLCPVLPDGWFVESGTYRLANGGWLDIAYRGPSGARVELREGAFCPDTSGCVPGGHDVDDVPFGPFVGRRIATDAGGWAAVVDRGAQLSWLLDSTGVDEAGFGSIASSLAVVEE